MHQVQFRHTEGIPAKHSRRVLDFDFIECFTTTFLHAHSWLNWVDEDDDEAGLKEKPGVCSSMADISLHLVEKRRRIYQEIEWPKIVKGAHRMRWVVQRERGVRQGEQGQRSGLEIMRTRAVTLVKQLRTGPDGVCKSNDGNDTLLTGILNAARCLGSYTTLYSLCGI